MKDIVYILFIGEYSRKRVLFVSSDVKFIANEYVKNLYDEYDLYCYPTVEIWKDKQEDMIGYFSENVASVRKVTAALSKRAMELV